MTFEPDDDRGDSDVTYRDTVTDCIKSAARKAAELLAKEISDYVKLDAETIAAIADEIRVQVTEGEWGQISQFPADYSEWRDGVQSTRADEQRDQRKHEVAA